MKKLVKETSKHKGPVYIRLARGGDKIVTSSSERVKLGKGNLKIKPDKHLFITTGVMTQLAIEASKKLNKDKNINCGVIHLGTVKPLDKDILLKWIPKVKKIVTVEENVLLGGFGSSILEFINDNFPEQSKKISRIGLKDNFIEKYGNQDLLFKDNNLTVKNLIKEILK